MAFRNGRKHVDGRPIGRRRDRQHLQHRRDVGHPNLSSYSAAKGGVRNLSKTVAMHCAKQGYNIRRNSIHLGSTDTPTLARVHYGVIDERHVRGQKNLPVRRIGQPEEVAKPLHFLTSDDASYISPEPSLSSMAALVRGSRTFTRRARSIFP